MSNEAKTLAVLKEFLRKPLQVPDNAAKVLLHVCCATCSGEIIEAIQATGAAQTVYFYNPNIFPRDEYEHRKADVKRFVDKLHIPFVDEDYDDALWLDTIKGHENDPERGERCNLCFTMRLWRTARYAFENKIPVFATSLGISRWKNMDQVNGAGAAAAAAFEGITYWDYNWRKGGGADRRFVIAEREAFYQQDYCGCPFSLAARNKRLKEKNSAA